MHFRGPSIEPYETPEVAYFLHSVPCKFTNYFLFVR